MKTEIVLKTTSKELIDFYSLLQTCNHPFVDLIKLELESMSENIDVIKIAKFFRENYNEQQRQSFESNFTNMINYSTLKSQIVHWSKYTY